MYVCLNMLTLITLSAFGNLRNGRVLQTLEFADAMMALPSNICLSIDYS
jgi:hypothetical protein